ncbi:glycosyltransferase family 2 protein [Devosia sp.]|uniref:glycosyltransferase family 2 protein n=1 Tax=Devosia sp. TaxID=1871048 RepID=UPI003BABDBB3
MVAILLATRNGAGFLDEQLQSVSAQDWARIDVWASDDGSTDDTPALLAKWAGGWTKGRFTLLAGPQQGFAGNFRALVASLDIAADYVAFCDQDDVWLPGKLKAAVAVLEMSGDRPALYCERTIITDGAGKEVGRSPLFLEPVGFANALVQSIAGGNTMVMNQAAHQLMREAARRSDFVSHDWFCYMMISGAGGTVTYSTEPHVLYRQHGDNLVGSNTGWAARLERLSAAMGGRFTRWTDHNLKTLDACADLLTEEARARIAQFRAARSGSLPARLRALRQSGVYRQSRVGQALLYLAVVLGKL